MSAGPPFGAGLRIESVRPVPAVEDLLASFAGLPAPFLFESGLDVAGMGRWHVAGAHPIGAFEVKGRAWTARLGAECARGDEDPWSALENWWRAWGGGHEADAATIAELGIPFAGGAAGYLGYEFGELIENFPARERAEADAPDVQLHLFDEVLCIERTGARAFWLHRARAGGERRRFWEQARSAPIAAAREAARPAREAGVSIGRDEYLRAVGEIRESIRIGDVYEVNLTRRHEFQGGPAAEELYRRLRVAQPVPYAAFLPWQPVAVVSASPERFLRRTGTFVETRPIKGTIPRGATLEDDRRRAGALLASEKERAELAMIIDLERNDLGRVCLPGTIAVAEEAAVETYATVLHTVATVRGRVPAELSPAALLRATFPGGSITGAPKIAAMKAIRRFEPVPRKVYTGAIGWIAPNGDLDLSIAIRTAYFARGRVYVSLGGAITWDSVPEAELAELEAKGRAIFAALCGPAP